MTAEYRPIRNNTDCLITESTTGDLLGIENPNGLLGKDFRRDAMNQLKMALGQYLLEDATDNIIAFATGAKVGATQLVSQTSRVSVVASIGDSVLLPAAIPGLEMMVINHGANAMQVFGKGADTINDLTAATGVSQMVNSLVIYTCISAGVWYTEGLAAGFSGGFATQSFSNNLAASATQTYAGGTPITTMIVRFSTVAVAGNAASLPTAAGGMSITVTNAGANAMGIYPAGTDAINSAGNGAVYSLPSGKTATFNSAGAGFWHAVLSA
jgi:hypothetical protein